MQDPYLELLSQMRKQGKSVNPPGIRLAEVVAPLPEIIIKMGDLQIDKDNILIADYLLKEEKYIRQFKTSSDKVNWSSTNYIKFVDTLKKGELLAVMPVEDKQLYIVLARLKEVS